jgi:hypothetical protein
LQPTPPPTPPASGPSSERRRGTAGAVSGVGACARWLQGERHRPSQSAARCPALQCRAAGPICTLAPNYCAQRWHCNRCDSRCCKLSAALKALLTAVSK